ncbi:MAG: lantibiotic ABC transporter, partial [Dehalococcoidia bacterium]|nr:lantibiotic ABC transporter [Dehalococcoidia bacterium]
MAEKLILEGFKPFVGKHCEPTAVRRALDYHGLTLSEETLLGLGGG